MVILIKIACSVYCRSLIPKMSMFIHSCHLLLDHVLITLIHGSNIPGSYAILFFTVSDCAFTTRHIHYWASFPLWPRLFILSGAISNHLPLFPSSIWTGSNLRGLSSGVTPFYTVCGVLEARILEWFAITSSSGACFVRTLHYDPSILGSPAWHGW